MKLCKDCKFYRLGGHHYTDDSRIVMDWHYCGHPEKVETHTEYVLGCTRQVYLPCRSINTDGQCKLHEVKE